MKSIYLTTIAMLATFAVPALAETPNSITMSWSEFVEASGCVIVDKGGYSNLALAADPTDPCPSEVRVAFFGVGSAINAGADGVLGTADDYRTSDR